MREMFDDSLKLVLMHEGGWSDHPLDPGGATMQGVTLKTYSNWLGRPATKDELRNMPAEHRDAIYRKLYWERVQADELPAGVDLAVFDCAVNSGPGRAAMLLQQAIGVWPDGVIGPKTMAAIKAADAKATVDRFCDLRLAFLRGLPTWPTFGKGWERRVKDVRQQAKGMVG
jgi:lysozyme family protein